MFTSAYYLAAYRVFPGDQVNVTDLDSHFLRIRKFVVAMVILARVLQLTAVALIPDFAPALTNPFTLGTFALVFGLPDRLWW